MKRAVIATIAVLVALSWGTLSLAFDVNLFKAGGDGKLPDEAGKHYLIADSLVLTSPGTENSDKFKASLGEDGFNKASCAFSMGTFSGIIIADFDWKPTRGVAPGTFRVFVPVNSSAEIEALVNGQTVWKHTDSGTDILSPELTIPSSETKPDVTIRVRKSGTGGGVNDVYILRQLTDKPMPARGVKVDAPPAKLTETGLPAYGGKLVGRNEVRVRNPNEFTVSAGIRTGTKGRDLHIPANGVASAFVPDGKYDIYFVYSSQPDALFRGDPFELSRNGVEIQIVKMAGGNYSIRRAK